MGGDLPVIEASYTVNGIKDQTELIGLGAAIASWMIDHPDTVLTAHSSSETFPPTAGCCSECAHYSHSACVNCGMSDSDCVAIIWPELAR